MKKKILAKEKILKVLPDLSYNPALIKKHCAGEGCENELRGGAKRYEDVGNYCPDCIARVNANMRKNRTALRLPERHTVSSLKEVFNN